jgi:tetratricopeptide (TPR) repeat protein
MAEAVESFKDGLKLKPRNLVLSANLGNALVSEGSFLSSLIHFKNALDIDPKNNAVWTNLTIPLRAVKSANPSIVREILDPQGKYGANAENVFQHNTAYKVHQASALPNDTLAEALRCLRKTANRSIQNPKKISHQKNLHDYQNLIALIPFGRSGTGLMHSLIDGHPDVATLPSIYFSEFFDFQTWERITSGGWDKITERFVDAYPILFDARSRSPVATKGQKYIADLGEKEGLTFVGDKRNESLAINKSIFSGELKKLVDSCETLDALKLLKLIHRAHDRMLGLKDRKVLLYHIHNPDTYAKLNFLSFAPKAKWVMMVRDPIQSLESWIRDSFEGGDFEGVTAKIIFMFTEVYNLTSAQVSTVGVKLEDLKNQPEKTIQALCHWMEIKDDPSLYEMTMQGKKWWGDPNSQDYESDGMNPFGTKSINRDPGNIFSERDQFIFKTLFFPFNVRFGYVDKNIEKFHTDLRIIRPLLDEPFEFEKQMHKKTGRNFENFKRSGRFLYLRALLFEHWNFQNNKNHYPNMLNPLKVVY